MPKVVIGPTKCHGSVFDTDFRLTSTTSTYMMPYQQDPIEQDSGLTDVGRKLLERISGLAGVEHVSYRPFSFGLEIGWAFKIQEVVDGVLDIIRGLGAEEDIMGAEIDLYYMRTGGVICQLRQRDYEHAMRELMFD
jgi:hypothetical protein